MILFKFRLMKKQANSINNVLIIFSVALIFGLTSCFDSNYDFNNISDEVELTPGISIPVAFGSLKLDDILNEIDTGDFVKQFAEDSLLYVTYSTNLFSYKASEVIDVPDQNFLQLFIGADIAATTILPVPVGESITFSKNKDGEFVFSNGEKIDSINMKSVRMFIDVTSSFHHTGKLIISSNNVIINGVPFSKEIPISSATGTFTYSFNELINNVKVVLDNSDADTTVLPLKFDLSLINSGAAVQPGEACNITMSFRENVFSSIFGYLGNYDIPVDNGQLDVSLFNQSVQGGNLFFADPRIALTINNSYGIPIQIDLSGMEVVSAINSSTTPINFIGVNPFDILAPDLADFGSSLYSEIPINKDNSNIVEAMESSPNHLNYTATAKTNAAGPTGPYNFVTDSSNMDLGIEIVLPLWVKAEGFSLEDTLDFDFKKEISADIDMVEYFRLTFDADNGIPLETKLQVYFADTTYTVLDSLFKDNEVFLEPAVLVGESNSDPVKTIKRVEFTKAELEKIKRSKYLFVRASVNTPSTGNGYFKFYSYYGIDFKISAKAEFRVNSKNL